MINKLNKLCSSWSWLSTIKDMVFRYVATVVYPFIIFIILSLPESSKADSISITNSSGPITLFLVILPRNDHTSDFSIICSFMFLYSRFLNISVSSLKYLLLLYYERFFLLYFMHCVFCPVIYFIILCVPVVCMFLARHCHYSFLQVIPL